MNVVQSSANKTDDLDDDEEIVFQKVEDNQMENNTALKKRKRKIYDEKKLRLVACLNLVSSESESEDTEQMKNSISTSGTAALSPVVTKKYACKECETNFPDSQSLSVHERIHEGVKCVLCKIGFPQVKRLIHHMRRKHREYNGDALSEKPRSGQDSCMTIRLRYMQQTTFYECQLCGRIDDVFREHKEHILEKHPNESKSLKDPIIKQLKCPVCKIKCGAQYLFIMPSFN
ncbi:Zinc finger protein 423 [Eumeta japonica]|uniref:Zinc finger protein 423 n=1 Tax=Eumeta variegata TaxID=151549 RepID=A0A4C1TN13_EUMVA|nr:Zinc finger protein 423 [Eumeta japonica]